MQSDVPAPGTVVWIRQRRWRVERARRENRLVRLDVSGRTGHVTFLAPFDRPCASGRAEEIRRVSPHAFVARLAGVVGRATTYRAVASAIGAAVEILPYQLEPALAILRGERRLLIADAVGLGKTVEAGLVIAELRRRDPSMRALVIVPSPLIAQWSNELRDRFGIASRRADAESLTALARLGSSREPLWHRPGVWLASIDYLKQPHVIGGVFRMPWDLLVVDEAHGVCGDSERHRAAAELARRARRVLLLTATPHDGDEEKFVRLLELGALPPDEAAPAIFRRTRAALGAESQRRIRWRTVRLAAEESRLLDALGDFERAVLRASGGAGRQSALLLSVFRKRALSTATACAISIERRLAWLASVSRPEDETEWRQPTLTFEGDDDAVTPDERRCLAGDSGLERRVEQSWLRRLLEASRAAARRERKVAYLEALLRRTTEPAAVFTEFRDSLCVLERRLAHVRRTAVLHGGLTAPEQAEQLERFCSGAATLLLATDVASQGLNLQARCRWVLNLELPWNPVRIEQRAGRVDRIGQHRPVRVGLLVSDHPSESGMLCRLVRRTLAARQTLGGDVLGATAPDEASIRLHLLAGVPLAEVTPPQRPAPFCRRWARPAASAARQLARQRRLASLWRAEPRAGGCCVGQLDRLPALRRIAGDGALLCLLVPIVDGWGDVLEQHVVAVGACSLAATRDPQRLDDLRRRIAPLFEPRARRLRRLRLVETARIAADERAIHAVLRQECNTAETQPGLFDSRAVRLSERAAEELAELERALMARLHELDARCALAVGAPVLAFAAAAGPRA